MLPRSDAERPAAYADDYNPVPKIAGGAFLLVRMVRRHNRTAHRGHAAAA